MLDVNEKDDKNHQNNVKEWYVGSYRALTKEIEFD